MSASLLTEVIIVVIFALLLLGIAALINRRPRKLNAQYFEHRWQELQKKCSNKDTWPIAVIDADKLLDEALRKLRYKGKSMGERLAAAQRDIKDNDAAWYGHKLRNRIVHENTKLSQSDVKEALIGIKQALKDLKAL